MVSTSIHSPPSARTVSDCQSGRFTMLSFSTVLAVDVERRVG